MSFIRRIKRGGRVYLAEVENRRIEGKVVQHHIRYVGREADGKTVLAASLSQAEIEQVKLYGPLLVLHHLAKKIHLPERLGSYSQEILSLVYAHCLDYRSLNHMPQWLERTDLNFLLDLDGLTEKRLVNALDDLEGLDADAFQREIFQSLCQHYRLRPSGVIYDVTNTYLYGRRCPMGKPGHDKEGVKGRPLVQIGLAVTQKEGFPLFHKVFDGNVHDARTLADLVTLFGSYQLEAGLFIYDRGIVSKRSVEQIKKLHWDALCGIPIHPALQEFWRPWASPERMLRFSNRVRVGSSVFYTLMRPYKMGAVRGRLALCLNEQRQRETRESRRDEILYAQKLLAEGKAIKPGLRPFFDTQGRLCQDKLEAAEQFDGYSCIFSTRFLPTEDMLSLYFNKDLVEKAFRSLKGITQLRPVRHWLAERVRAHVFLCYLAYLLLSLFRYHLRDTDFTPEKALSELTTMYKVYLRDDQHRFRLWRTVPITKNQELILRAIDKSLLKDLA